MFAKHPLILRFQVLKNKLQPQREICRRLFGKLPRNTRHPMVEASERFFLMGLLQRNVKSSRSEVFCKKSVRRSFTKFTGKHRRQSLFFNKVAGPRPVTLLKKRLWHRCYPVNFVKFLRTPFIIEHLWWLLLTCAGVSFEYETSAQVFSCEFL